MGDAKRDANYIPTLLAVSNADGSTPVTLYADPTTHRLLVSASAGALDDLSDVVITSPTGSQVLVYNAGSATWINETITASIIGTDTYVLFFDGANSPKGDAGFTYNKTTDSATLVGSLTVGTGVYISANDGGALGLSGTAFSDLFLASGAVINFNAGDVTLTHGANILTLGGGDFALGANSLTMTGTIAATGARVATGYFTNLDVTNTIVGTATNVVTNANLTGPITSVGNATSIGSQTGTGTQFVVSNAPTLVNPTITTKLNPTTDDGAPLGDTTHNWSDLFLASGALINIANSNWVATHTSGILTVGTGDLRVTTQGSNTASVVTVGGAADLTNKTLTSATLVTPLLQGGSTLTLGENASIVLDTSLSADGKYCGISESATAGTALTFGQLIYLHTASANWVLANSGTSSTSTNQIGICVLAAGGAGSTTTVLRYGKIRADAQFPTLTVGAPVYVGTVNGTIQVAQPTGTDQVIRIVGFSNSADELFFNPSNDYITHI